MNKGFLQSSTSSSSSSLAMSLCHHDSYQELPVSWSQLLLGGSPVDAGWEDQMAAACDASAAARRAESRYVYGPTEEEIQQQQLADEAASWASWGRMNSSLPVSSPGSCVTTASFGGGNNVLDFSAGGPGKRRLGQPALDHSSECNSKETGAAASKKIKVVSCSAQSTLKVRKEKLGDRITALHQLVSPFGKTDTASVLLEAIGYIRFLHNQIEALSSPYLGRGEPDGSRQPAVSQ